MSVFKVRYEKDTFGGHYLCTVFVAPASDKTYDNCGEFYLRADELASLRASWAGAEFYEYIPQTPMYVLEEEE